MPAPGEIVKITSAKDRSFPRWIVFWGLFSFMIFMVCAVKQPIASFFKLTEAASLTFVCYSLFRLFACLHELDAQSAELIAVSPVPDHGLGRAINDRLKRAAAPR